jgi:hypothetical protein
MNRVRVSFEQRDLRAFARHLQGNRATEPLTGAADNANLIRQQTHSIPRVRRL